MIGKKWQHGYLGHSNWSSLIFTFVKYSYFIITFPILTLIVWNQHVRFVTTEIATHYLQKTGIVDVTLISVGDSIMAGGKHWSWGIRRLPFDSMNLAGNGYTTKQIYNQIKGAMLRNPKVIMINGGTNDLLDSDYDENIIVDQTKANLALFSNTEIKAILVLVPYQSDKASTKKIASLNARLMEVATDLNIITVDLNDVIAPNGVLLKKYTTDGVHLTDSAYDLWSGRLHSLIPVESDN